MDKQKPQKSKQTVKTQDPRFVNANEDPRFQTLPKSKTKVKVDSRFASVVKDKDRFDKTDELYYLEEEAKEQEESVDQSEEVSEEELSEEMEVEEQEDLFTDEDDNIVYAEESTNRIAMQNYAWQHIKATDIFLIFESLAKSLEGKINVGEKPVVSVDVYMSDFGAQKLKLEQEEGPKELFESAMKMYKNNAADVQTENEEEDDQNKDEESQGLEENEQTSPFDPKLLRKYERDRLKYYFAIITLKDKCLVEAIYDECDGMEVELSGCKLDLRVVPDSVKIDKEPLDSCKELTAENKTRLSEFMTKAVAHTNVDLTWEAPQKRNLDFLFTDGKVNPDRLKSIVNLEEDDSQEDEEDMPDSDQEDEEDADEEIANKLKLLTQKSEAKAGFESYNKSNKNKSRDINITFKVGFGESTSAPKPQEDKTGRPQKREYNPFVHKGSKLFAHQNVGAMPLKGSEREGFFDGESVEEDKPLLDGPKRKSRKELIQGAKEKKQMRKEQRLNDEAELELLVDSNKQAKRKLEDFKPNFEDPRFSALYTDSKFQIDPTNPRYNEGSNKEFLLQKNFKKVKRE